MTILSDLDFTSSIHSLNLYLAPQAGANGVILVPNVEFLLEIGEEKALHSFIYRAGTTQDMVAPARPIFDNRREIEK